MVEALVGLLALFGEALGEHRLVLLRGGVPRDAQQRLDAVGLPFELLLQVLLLQGRGLSQQLLQHVLVDTVLAVVSRAREVSVEASAAEGLLCPTRALPALSLAELAPKPYGAAGLLDLGSQALHVPPQTYVHLVHGSQLLEGEALLQFLLHLHPLHAEGLGGVQRLPLGLEYPLLGRDLPPLLTLLRLAGSLRLLCCLLFRRHLRRELKHLPLSLGRDRHRVLSLGADKPPDDQVELGLAALKLGP